MTDRYAVIGHPVAHSRSPEIHTLFAQQTGEDIVYERLLAPLPAFRETVAAFRAAGGKGLNVTLPFKPEACRYADVRSPAAAAADAVNTLRFDEGVVFGDNTDGIGLVRDIEINLATAIAGRRVLLIGAGGAARGVLGLLAEAKPQCIVIVNRTHERAVLLARQGGLTTPVEASRYEQLDGTRFDLVINASAASLEGAAPPIPDGVFSTDALAYDMVYGKGITPFMAQAAAAGARAADGLGMLVEQAAESFFIWRGKRPDAAAVLARLRG